MSALIVLTKSLGQILVNQGPILVKNSGKFITRSEPCTQPNVLIFMVFGWRRRRLPLFGNKMKIEASVLFGGRDEEVEVHGKSDCGDLGRRRCGAAGGRGLQKARDQ